MTFDELNFSIYTQTKNVLNGVLIENFSVRYFYVRYIFSEFFMNIVEDILKNSCFAKVANMLQWQLKS